MTRPGEATLLPSVKFEFATAGQVVFGAGCGEEALPGSVSRFGRRALLVTGSEPLRFPKLLSALEKSVDLLDLYPVRGEPTITVVAEGCEHARALAVDVVIGLGGGSALDAGKAIAALATNHGNPLEYVEVFGAGKPLARPPLPFIAIPTTAGTGAEVTRNAVLTIPDARAKASLRSALMLPKVAIVDPTLAHGLPAATTASTGLDALTQLIEPFLSCRANPLTDALCRDGISRAARALPIACRDPANGQARAELALAALYSGMALANAGLGAVHGFASAIGGAFAAPHGAVCAALLPSVLRVNLAAVRARGADSSTLLRFDELARLLTGDAVARADDAVAACSRLVSDLGIPKLAAWGVTAADVEGITAGAARSSSMKANPIVLTREELCTALVAAI